MAMQGIPLKISYELSVRRLESVFELVGCVASTYPMGIGCVSAMVTFPPLAY